MVVSSEEELKSLLSQGYHLYKHRGVNRWYVYLGEDRRIVDARLESVCETLHSERGVSAGEIQEMRYDGRTIADIASATGLDERTVSNALERSPDHVIVSRARSQSGSNPPKEPQDFDALTPLIIVAAPFIFTASLWAVGNLLMGSFSQG
jgi:DNA-binding transcriptional ArsR family regulator